MNVIKVTYELHLDDTQKKIIEHLDANKEIIFAINTDLSFEGKDLSNQFRLINLTRLQTQKITASKLFEYEKGSFGRKYFLTDLGFKALEQLTL